MWQHVIGQELPNYITYLAIFCHFHTLTNAFFLMHFCSFLVIGWLNLITHPLLCPLYSLKLYYQLCPMASLRMLVTMHILAAHLPQPAATCQICSPRTGFNQCTFKITPELRRSIYKNMLVVKT